MFTTSVDVEAKAVLTAKNSGSTAVYYKWTRCESAKMAGARPDETVRFFLADMQGSILPGCSKNFAFTFVSHASGTCVPVHPTHTLIFGINFFPRNSYAEDWEMSSLPAVPATQHRITLRGVSVVDDLDTGDGGGASAATVTCDLLLRSETQRPC